MKIGVDAKWYFSGCANTYVQNILRSLARIDNENEYIYYVKPGDPVCDPELKNDRVSLRNLYPSFSLPRVKYSLVREAKKEGFNILFTQSLYPGTKKIPSVVTIHDVLYKDFPQYFTLTERLYFKFIDDSIKKADLITCVSQYTKRKIVEWFGRKESDIFIVPPAKSLKKINDNKKLEIIKRKYNLPSEFLLYVGRLNVRKNIPRLFRALSQCKFDAPLVCVGKKDWKSDPLEKIVRDLGLENRIIFTGFAPDDEVQSLMNLATCFIYVPFAEGFGIPPLQAMSCHCPVIVSNTTSLPEVVGDAGILVNPESVEEITEAINKVLGDSDLREEMKKKNVIQAAKFQWEKSAATLTDVWKKCL
jgi:glycosyltransferase involved in cell wall biosynthesis